MARLGQTSSLLPPDSEVDDEVKPLVLEGQLPLVDDQSGVKTPFGHGMQNLVEGQHLIRKSLRQEEPQSQEGRR